MDAGNMLKPALARGELHCVGATTLDEYRKYIEKDAALERRFQKILVGEPTVEATIAFGPRVNGFSHADATRRALTRLRGLDERPVWTSHRRLHRGRHRAL